MERPGYGIINRPDGSRVVVAPSARETPDELGRFLTGGTPDAGGTAARSSGGTASGNAASGGPGFPFYDSGN